MICAACLTPPQVKRLSNYVNTSMDGSTEADMQMLKQQLQERSAELSSIQEQLVAVVQAKAQLQRQVSALKLLLSDKVGMSCACYSSG